MHRRGMGTCIENAQITIRGLSKSFNFHLMDIHLFKTCGEHFIFIKRCFPKRFGTCATGYYLHE